MTTTTQNGVTIIVSAIKRHIFYDRMLLSFPSKLDFVLFAVFEITLYRTRCIM